MLPLRIVMVTIWSIFDTIYRLVMNLTRRSRVARQRTRQLDEVLNDVRVPEQPRNGWIDSIREALGLTKTQLARRMGIARPNLNKLEANEISGSITLSSLQKAARALECELKYVLVPVKSLSETVQVQALHRAQQKLSRVNQSQALEASAMESTNLSNAIADLARELEVQRSTDLWND
jgi:predicted DNA-binding mobile mystery protein A